MIRTIIIDDEPSAINVLVLLLKKNWKEDVEVIATSDSPQEGKLLIELHKPHLLFLDIEMPGMSGIDLIRSIPNPDFHIVFVTAYDAYAIEAFDLCAIDYLLKPVGADKVARVIERIKKQTKEKKVSLNTQLQQLEGILKQTSFDNGKKISLGMSDKIIFPNINDILYCEAKGPYTNVHLQDGKNIITSKSLGDFEEQLSTHNFFRIHHSYLINLNHVLEFQRHDGGYVIIDKNIRLEVSTRKRKEFLDTMNHFTL
jgi:two-component system LytT family response regulator